MAQMPAQQESSDCVISSEGSFKYGVTASVDEVLVSPLAEVLASVGS
eukprot:CAMPEP_0185813768 /NCGR_PEP_ID=MMETSP1322-20130828/12354_1 /TAXON_ID=265543 /ORGANISM="Minutocellus polymorphus, Strain RCC2270" /LENGTH=46 /DNA_ID= /DNA_START= /DNA_END= /DNA_ORIENTATION=